MLCHVILYNDILLYYGCARPLPEPTPLARRAQARSASKVELPSPSVGRLEHGSCSVPEYFPCAGAGSQAPSVALIQSSNKTKRDYERTCDAKCD